MSDKYTLDDKGNPVAESDLLTWAKWFETAKRHVKDERLSIAGQEVRVSTVFLGMDHNWGTGAPVLWETMVFGGTLNEEQDRCAGSREQAEAMHAAMVERVRSTGANAKFRNGEDNAPLAK